MTEFYKNNPRNLHTPIKKGKLTKKQKNKEIIFNLESTINSEKSKISGNKELISKFESILEKKKNSKQGTKFMIQITIPIFGCSFSAQYNGTFDSQPMEGGNQFDFEGYTFQNFGQVSSSNYKIYNTFKTNIKPNDICIIQWSALTRLQEDDYDFLIKTEETPLYYFLNKWYEILDKVQEISKEKNITLIQHIGWAQWKDNELNEYHRNKLNSYGITWFSSKETWDRIDSNCFQFQSPSIWSSSGKKNNPNSNELYYYWDNLKWGGMSEWIRDNVEIENRYLGYHHPTNPNFFDAHPSMYANKVFFKNQIIKKLNQWNILT